MESYHNVVWERQCMYNFQNYNKIDYICKVGSPPFVTMKTKQLNRPDVKVTL